MSFTLTSSNTLHFAFHDIDNDGDLDFFYSIPGGKIGTKVNTAGPNALPSLSDNVPDEISNLFPASKIWGAMSIYFEFLDMDNDGDVYVQSSHKPIRTSCSHKSLAVCVSDLFFFDQTSAHYHENIADDKNFIPMFIPVPDASIPILEPANVIDRVPTFGDLDGDG